MTICLSFCLFLALNFQFPMPSSSKSFNTTLNHRVCGRPYLLLTTLPKHCSFSPFSPPPFFLHALTIVFVALLQTALLTSFHTNPVVQGCSFYPKFLLFFLQIFSKVFFLSKPVIYMYRQHLVSRFRISILQIFYSDPLHIFYHLYTLSYLLA